MKAVTRGAVSGGSFSVFPPFCRVEPCPTSSSKIRWLRQEAGLLLSLSLPSSLALCLQKHERKANESLPLGGGKEIYIYIWVCVERDKTVLVMLIHRVHPWEPSEAASHRVDGELTWSAGC